MNAPRDWTLLCLSCGAVVALSRLFSLYTVYRVPGYLGTQGPTVGLRGPTVSPTVGPPRTPTKGSDISRTDCTVRKNGQNFSTLMVLLKISQGPVRDLSISGGGCPFLIVLCHFQVHRYTGTQVHRYTGTQVHRYTGTQVHRYTGTQVHRYTGTQVHRYTGTQVHRYTGTQVHRYTGTQVHRYTGTQVHRYTGTPHHVLSCAS